MRPILDLLNNLFIQINRILIKVSNLVDYIYNNAFITQNNFETD